MYRKKYDAARALDQVAINFERQFIAGERPIIEEYVRMHPDVDADALVAELLAIELELRRNSGECPSPVDYESRLSEFPAVVETCFAQTTDIPVDGEEPTVAPHGAVEESGLPQIDGYDVVEKVGEGGMGTVYRAHQHSPDRVVAIKTIRSGTLASEKEHERFRAEAEAVAKLDHAGIVPLLSVGDTDGLPYLTMPFVHGETLSKRVSQGTFASRDAAVFVQMLADAVAHAHSRRLVHRDIKPGNILVTAEGVPRLTDFGLVSDTGADDRLTQTGEVLGTPSFMSPEQARGMSEAVGECSDIYSIGAVLYFMLTGKPPHQGTTPLETLTKVLNEDVVRPRVIDRSIAQDIETICLKCLKKEPNERYVSAVALSKDLQRYLNGQAIMARPDSAIRRITRWGQREPWRAGALGLLILMICGAFSGVVAYSDYQRLEQEKLTQARIEADRKFVDDDRARLSTALRDRLLIQRIEDFRQQGNIVSAKGAFAVMSQQGFLRRYLDRSLTSHGSMVKVDQWQAGNWSVLCSVQSPDGSQIICADHGGQLLLRDLEARRSRSLFAGFSDGEGGCDHWVVRQRRPEAERGNEPLFVSLKWPKPALVYLATLDGKVGSIDPTEAEPTLKEIVDFKQRLHCMDVDAETGRILVGTAAGSVFRVIPENGETALLPVGKVPITAICHWRAKGLWLVGDDEGVIYVIDPTGKQVTHRVDVWDRIWALSTAESGDVVAATDSGPVILGMLNDEFRVVRRFDAGPSKSSAAHEVAFSKDGRHIISAGAVLRLGLWNLASGQLQASWVNALSDRRLSPDLRKKLPLPLQRHAGGIHFGPDDLIGMTDHVGVLQWLQSRKEDQELPFRESEVVLGERPDVFFSKDDDYIWALSGDGRLSLIDAETLQPVDCAKAHQSAVKVDDRRRAAEIRRLGQNSIATVARSKAIRFWTVKDAKIREITEPGLSGPAEFLSIDVCTDRSLIAAVDSRAHLLVWNLKSGRKLFDQRVHGSVGADGPTVGTVRFSSDGSRIAVTGSLQATHVYETANFAVVEDAYLKVAGKGAIDLEWSTEREMLVTHDSLSGGLVWQSDPRLVAANDRNNNLRRLLKGTAPTDLLIDIDAIGPSGFVTLYDSGTVVFLSADHYLPIGQIKTPARDSHTVAINHANTQLVISTTKGRLVSLSLEDKSRPLPETTHTIDVEPVLTTAVPVTVREFGLGSDSSPHFCVFEIPREEKLGGRLSLVTRTGQPDKQWQIDRVEIDADDEWAMPGGSGTAVLRQGGRTQLIYRRKRPDLAQYAFDLILAERTSSGGAWSYERVVKGMNAGQNVIPHCDEAGTVVAIAHMTASNFHGLVSTRGDQTEIGWPQTRLCSRRFLNSGVRSDNAIHGLVGVLRLPADPLPPRYAVWDGKGGLQEEPLPRGVSHAHLYQLPDGTPLVRLVWLDTARPCGWYVRKPDGWEQHFADRGTHDDSFAILDSGALARVAWGSQKRVLRVEANGKAHEFKFRGLPGQSKLGCQWSLSKGHIRVVIWGEAAPGEWDVWYGEMELAAL